MPVSKRLPRLLPVVTMAAMLCVSCGGSGETQEDEHRTMEEVGTIESGDARDPDHMDLAYDGYTFQGRQMDLVTISVEADGFTPLLKLMEVSTGAPLAEWDSQYSESGELTYTLAVSGVYEVRVYSTDEGTGEYTLTIELNR